MNNNRFLSFTKYSVIALLICVGALTCWAQNTCTLKVNVSGMGSTKGTLYAVLYDQDGYMKNKLQTKNVRIKKAATYTFSFEGLQRGKYAVTILLDENNNGQVDSNSMGMPTEMIGFSNNAPCSYGPPSFQETAVTLDGDRTIQVEMYYFHL